ncbi:MAG: reverse transcriptase-like protein [Firmicutes bacterium]|nr:reverse transcriptase-like protein [Bacillota bacterium]
MSDFIKIFIDGAARGNPGPAGIGVAVYDSNGISLLEISDSVGNCTNNQAEYNALLIALKESAPFNSPEIRIFSDSELLVKQMRGEYRVRDEKLKELFCRARKLIAGKKVSFFNIRREENKRADQLANRGIDENFIPSASEKRDERPRILHPTETAAEEERREELQISAGGVVYKKEGSQIKICLIAKKNRKVWAIPKGRVEPGESPEFTAEREILEETGLLAKVKEKIDEIDYYFYWKDNDTLYHKVVYFYLMPVVEVNYQKKDSEADAVAWFTPGEAYKMLTYLNEKEVVRKAQKLLY